MNGIKAIVPPETPGTLSASAMQKPWNAVKIMETTYFLLKHRLRGGEHRAQRKDKKENVPAHALRGEPAARAEQHRCRLDEAAQRQARASRRKAERQQPSRAGRAHQEYEQAAEECGSRRALPARRCAE